MLYYMSLVTIREINIHPPCVSLCRRYARCKAVHPCLAHPWSWAIGSSTNARPRSRFTWSHAVTKPGHSC